MSTTAQTPMVQTWRYYSYDVWGNADDGYDVNQVFRTSDQIDIPTDCTTDAQLFLHLVQIGFFTGKNLRVDLFETDGDEETIYLEYDGKPEGELRLENPNH